VAVFIKRFSQSDEAEHSAVTTLLISPWRGIGLRSVHCLCSNSLKAETHDPTNVGRQCRLPDTRTIDGRHLIRSFMLLTVILIIISFPSPTLSFIPDSKTSFFANPSHCSLSFSSPGLTTSIPQTVYCYF